MKVLNLYAGLGGNRKLWPKGIEVTAVEIDRDIAWSYTNSFTNDIVEVGDAPAYLLRRFAEFDFIWASPPCPTHGQYRYNVGVKAKGYAPVYPDMTLYQIIIFLKHHVEVPWVVENVKPYYAPLIEPTATVQRHLIWSNREIRDKQFPATMIRTKNKVSDYDYLGFDTEGIANKRQALRNCLDPEVGRYIWDEAMNEGG